MSAILPSMPWAVDDETDEHGRKLVRDRNGDPVRAFHGPRAEQHAADFVHLAEALSHLWEEGDAPGSTPYRSRPNLP